MMPEVVAAAAAGSSVSVAVLFEFAFLSGTRRCWDGYKKLVAGGREWDASGDVISVTGMGYAEGFSANQVTFTMSGTTPDLLAAAVDSEREVTGRRCAVYLQFLTDRYKPLDQPVAIWAGRMDTLSFRGDVQNQIISMNAETLFSERIRAPWGLQTDSAQQARWPGDRGMEFMPSLKNKTVKWLRS